MNHTQQLRKNLRKQRLKLSKQQRQLASHHASQHLYRLPIRHKKQMKVGVFVDAFGELPTQPIIDWAVRHHYQIFLPVVIHQQSPLKFCRLHTKKLLNARLIRHSLGMKQPAFGHFISVEQLDILIMPLVALDKHGKRLGMGGGFYDKTLAKCKDKPLKIGWAYDFQLVEKLYRQTWDIDLDMAILPSNLFIFNRYMNNAK